MKDVKLTYPRYGPNARTLDASTDARGYSLGGCLMQDQVVNKVEGKRMIEHVSKTFNKTEKKYFTIKR